LQLAALIYTIAKVKEHCVYCGGPTTLKYLTTFSTGLDFPRVAQPTAVAPQFVERVESKLAALDLKTKSARNREIYAALREASDEFAKENWKAKP
jgi:hypothetical protein